MYSHVTSGTILGIHGVLIQVEADVSDGLPGFHMVGYLSGEVRESAERIRTAMRNSGFCLPPKKIVVNLSPADIRKGGAGYDLPIAVAILISMGYLPQKNTENILFLGELGLNGLVLPMNGVLPIADCARTSGYRTVVVPYENMEEASLIQGLEVIGISSLSELVEQLNGEVVRCASVQTTTLNEQSSEELPEADFRELKGQPVVRRAMEIAASGMHNLLMTGPPGAGKTLAAKCLTGILPDLSFEESMEITKIYSVKGLLRQQGGLIRKRPFRAPHHTITAGSLIGGGAFPVPGEVSLAHHGV
jgi:magnesium chelatase family protein